MNGVKTHENQLSNYHSMQTVTYSSRYNVDFQPYLKSVTIPNLDHFRTHECAAEISHLVGNEVKHILDWLRLVKGVRRILKLRVLDSRHRPHSEQTIEEAIKGLDVEELDWKRLDLSTKTVEEAAKRAHTLYLYCSGSWTPIYHWISPGGLESLKAVKRLHITIIKVSVTR
ncbi:hypothetical protein GGR58DRAFT_309029 [Xylaria digitata]|nr:hypothetical protein GGR58DRAFT_309029 [Xylaria digitata]